MDDEGYYVIFWTFTSAAFVLVCTRIAWRLKQASHLSLDDAFLAFSFFLLLVDAILHTLLVPWGLEIARVQRGGAPRPDSIALRPADALKIQWSAIVIFWNVLWSAKTSLILLQRRFVDRLPPYDKIWVGILVINSLMWVSVVLSQWLTCRPFGSAFALGADSCIVRQPDASKNDIYYGMVADIFTDLLIMYIPLRLIFPLNTISKSQKFGLVVLFSGGMGCMALAVARAVRSVAPDAAILPIRLMTWTQCEAAVAVVVACIPGLRGFFASTCSIRRHSTSSRTRTRPRTSSSRPGYSSPIRLGTLAFVDSRDHIPDSAAVLVASKSTPGGSGGWVTEEEGEDGEEEEGKFALASEELRSAVRKMDLELELGGESTDDHHD